MFLITLRTFILYVLIVCSLRLMGKRQLGELQPSELVVTILISNIATLPIEDTAVPLLGGVMPILLLVCFEIGISFLSLKFRAARKIISGNPVVVIKDGQLNQKKLLDLRFSIDDLMEELRSNSVFDIRDVDYAVVETNGKLSVYQKFTARSTTPQVLGLATPTSDCPPPAIVISDGLLLDSGLTDCKLTKAWLDAQLAQKSMEQKDVFLMICDQNAQYLLLPKDKNA